MPEILQFARFALVGSVGFLVDAAVLYALAWGGVSWLVGRLGSYVVAATATWLMNRRFTFSVRQSASVAEWVRFLTANSVGGLVNYGTYAVLISTLPLAATHPILGVGAGSVAGLVVNFTLSRHMVFKSEN